MTLPEAGVYCVGGTFLPYVYSAWLRLFRFTRRRPNVHHAHSYRALQGSARPSQQGYTAVPGACSAWHGAHGLTPINVSSRHSLQLRRQTIYHFLHVLMLWFKQCYVWHIITVSVVCHRYNMASADSLVDCERNQCRKWWIEHGAEIPIHWVRVSRFKWNWKNEKSSINKISLAIQLLTSRGWSWIWKGKKNIWQSGNIFPVIVVSTTPGNAQEICENLMWFKKFGCFDAFWCKISVCILV